MNNGKGAAMGLIIVVIVVAEIVVFFSLQSAKGSGMNKSHNHLHSLPPKTAPSGKSQKPQMSASQIREKVEQVIQRFRKDSLAFFVYQEAVSKDLPTTKIEMLMNEYGSYSIRPSLIAYFSQDRNLLVSSHLASCITDYLREHGVQSAESEWESSLEKYIWKTTQEEASRIVSQIKKQS